MSLEVSPVSFAPWTFTQVKRVLQILRFQSLSLLFREVGEYDWGCHQSIHIRGFFRTCMHRFATIATIELTKATLIIAQSVSKPCVILTTVRNIRSVEQILKATNGLIETSAGMPRWISALKLALRGLFQNHIKLLHLIAILRSNQPITFV